MVIKFSKHFINFLLTFRSLNLLNIYEKLKLINKTLVLPNKIIHMFKNVNKIYVLQHLF